ncbi:MAG TPA: NUDIX hydrolase [Acidimicrobiales bacterium]|nr:NUDIX hydrolase [Acidimicrobiales bacterium]
MDRLVVEAPDGSLFERDVAAHPGAVAVLAVNGRGEVGLIHQYRATVGRLCWEIPAGTLDREGETPLEAAKRELVEELGIAAGSWREIGRFMNSPGWTDQVMVVFEARDLDERPRDPDGPEERLAEVAWFAPEALRRVLRAEEALDSTTAVAVHRVLGGFLDER